MKTPAPQARRRVRKTVDVAAPLPHNLAGRSGSSRQASAWEIIIILLSYLKLMILFAVLVFIIGGFLWLMLSPPL